MSSGTKNGVKGLNLHTYIGVCNYFRIWIFHEKLENIKNEDGGVIGYKNWVRGLNLHTYIGVCNLRILIFQENLENIKMRMGVPSGIKKGLGV